ncbi:sugar kinase [Azospirillum picis]|uniref:2-dehydro-3-deoxygluconokinase n=1 Tax=Azospirillum picis TaxID=488438 RepID=A0ABU0MD79_9PROT|nr:sugar kinase [Azospirillum picis]MBP2297594.1 2-dehydro-3-deoxygluconokinase [Azospirillum picis]MDQ0531383.1 2-dehydro-3-deoxygluconokinase [Azospirillum picis]
MSDTSKGRIAALGECMIEMFRRPDGSLTMGFGGDTLNTAVYLARLGTPADYVTALGDDSISEDMVAAWASEGVGTGHVLRIPNRLPGLYLIETDASGERRFLYWRDKAPARELFALPQTPDLCAALEEYGVLYLSGISLAIWGEAGRERMFALLERVRAKGGKVAFDTNWRPRLWPDVETARAAFDRMLRHTDIALPGVTDLRDLYGDADAGAVLERVRAAGAEEIVLKLEQPGCLVVRDGETVEVPAIKVDTVVDTTAAGDSFSAGYLAARLRGEDPAAAATAAHRLASVVIQHRGAIIPRDAMPA